MPFRTWRLDDLELGAGDLRLDGPGGRHRCPLVLLTDDDQRRQRDGREPLGQVERRDGVAAAGVAARVGPSYPRSDRIDDVAALLAERCREPPADGWLDQRLHPLGLGRLDPLLPDRPGLGRHPAGGVAQRQAPEQAGRAQRQRLADHPAHGQADPVRACNAERAEQGPGVLGFFGISLSS
jgi:hypothetical protein